MGYDELVRLALQLDGVEESTSYGTPSLKRSGRFMLRLKEDGEAVAVKLDWATRDRLLLERPDVYYVTPHYEDHPALLARLAYLSDDAAVALLDASWRSAAKKKRS